MKRTIGKAPERRLAKKLRSQAGETLGETLISLLIGALALLMLAGTISSSSKIITMGRKKLDSYYYSNETTVVKMEEGGQKADITISCPSDNAVKVQTYSVQYYINDCFKRAPVVAYQY